MDRFVSLDVGGIVLHTTALGAVTTTNQLAAAEPDGSTVHQPTPSPDGTRVAWTVADGDEPGSAWIAVADLLTGRTQRYPVVFPPFYLSWSRSGRVLAALAGTPDGLEVTTVDLVTDDRRVATRGRPLFLDWSPTGELACHLGRHGRAVLEVVAAGGDRHEIAVDLGPFTAPQWHPGRDAILVATDRGTVVSVSGDGVARAVASTGTPGRFAASRRGPARLAVTGADGALGVVDLEDGSHTSVLGQPPIAWWWSPDGGALLLLVAGMRPDGVRLRHLVWADGVIVHEGAWFRPSRMLAEQVLPFPDQYARSHTPWLASSQGWVWSGSGDERGDGGSGVHVEHLGGTASTVAAGILAFGVPAPAATLL